METALTYLVAGLAVIVNVVAFFFVAMCAVFVIALLIFAYLAIMEWWENRKFTETIRKARKRVKDMGGK